MLVSLKLGIQLESLSDGVVIKIPSIYENTLKRIRESRKYDRSKILSLVFSSDKVTYGSFWPSEECAY